MTATHMIIVSGLSGSGRSAALKAFEDIGYYCVDNLPLSLLGGFVEFAQGSTEVVRTAIGIDIREKSFPHRFPGLYRQLQEAGHAVELLFLEASDRALVRRFSETRRPHTLARDGSPLLDAIRAERQALAGIRAMAERIIDTSEYTVHDLRQAVERRYAGRDAGRPMTVTIVSFGYKYGVPYEVDLLFDLRFLPNPHFVPDLKPLTGEDSAVREYVLGKEESVEFLERLMGFLTYLLPRYRSEGKSYLTIGFGCTGGKHRSVAVSLDVAGRLQDAGFEVNVKHRDMGESS